MLDSSSQPGVLLIMAAFSGEKAALLWSRAKAEAAWGPVAVESPRFDFTETDYYTPSMGDGLLKQLFAFERLLDPAKLAERKLEAIGWEAEYRPLAASQAARPLNLDPGYLTPAKLVLATTKDRDHRIYLQGGIFAEVTLHFTRGEWRPRPWTYPDYQRTDYHDFFRECRAYLRGECAAAR